MADSPGGSVNNRVVGPVDGQLIQAGEIANLTINNYAYDTAAPGRDQNPSDVSIAVPEDLVEHGIHGRGPLLDVLRDRVRTTGGRLVLHGPGGCGKTTVAYALARELGEERTVWWIDATTQQSLLAGLREVTVQAGAPREEVHAVWRHGDSAKDLLWRTLHRPGARPWVLVVDNADEPKLLDGWIREPGAGNTVLVTSRDQRPKEWWRTTELLPVAPLSAADGAGILLELAPDAGHLAEAEALAERLGGLPLALMLVGSFLSEANDGPVLPEARTPRSYAEYSAALDSAFPHAISVLAQDRELGYRQLLTHTWELSLDLLETRGVRAARPLLRLLSFFSPSPVPTAVLKASVLGGDEPFPDLDAAQLASAVKGLIGFGLLQHQRDGSPSAAVDSLSLHPLIGEVTRNQPAAVEQAEQYYSARTLALYARAAELDPADPDNWPAWRLLLPHCSVADIAGEGTPEEWLRLLAALAFRTAEFCRHTGLWQTAEHHLDESLDCLRGLAEPPMEELLATLYRHAYIKREMGLYREAEQEFRLVLRIAEPFKGPAHQNTLAVRIELARTLAEHGNLPAAESELLSAVAAMEQALGPEHEITLAARHELARVLRNLGKLDDAEAEFRGLCAGTERALGARHPLTLAARHELAYLLYELGDLAAARAEMSEVLGAETDLQGPDHPSTLVTRGGLAMILLDSGELDVAEGELRVLVTAWSEAGLEDHPHALLNRSNLAVLLTRRGNPSAAEQELRTVVDIMTATLGYDHPNSLRARTNLAACLTQQGAHTAAQTEFRTVLDGLLRQSCTETSETLAIHYALEASLQASADFPGLEAEQRAILTVESGTLGPTHPNVLITRSNIAASVLAQDRFGAARADLEQVIPELTAALGEESEQVVSARLNLATAIDAQGDPAAAREELQRLLPLAERGLGPSHDITQRVRSRLATPVEHRPTPPS
ncbi:hypothetical protein OK074_4544 [Actinobacteria bacterium OK074]|nr:hypothetical protein OK074_4544 [Actinobacteria bacterium OK074]